MATSMALVSDGPSEVNFAMWPVHSIEFQVQLSSL